MSQIETINSNNNIRVIDICMAMHITNYVYVSALSKISNFAQA